MKVIELINSINDGIIPNKIKYKDTIYTYEKKVYAGGYYDYYDDKNHVLTDMFYLDSRDLREEVEIIEDKKIEKIKILNCDNYVKKENYETILTMQEIALDIQTLKNKINEIIDYLEEKE